MTLFHLRASGDQVVSLANSYKHNLALKYVLEDFELSWKPQKLQYVLRKFNFRADGGELFFTELI